MRAFIAPVTDQLGTEAKFRIATPLILNVMGLFSSNMQALKQSIYQHISPFIVDDSKYRSAFDDAATELSETVRATMDDLGLTRSGAA